MQQKAIMKLFWLNLLTIIILISLLNVQGQLLNNEAITQGQPSTDETGVTNLTVVLKRGKRYLDFTKGSRMSWRCNVKNNILKVNTLWGYGFGFRANFPFPDKSDRRRPFFKRDVFQALTDVLDGHGLDGEACILKSYCTAHLSTDTDYNGGMLFKLLKYIFTLMDIYGTFRTQSLPYPGSLTDFLREWNWNLRIQTLINISNLFIQNITHFLFL